MRFILILPFLALMACDSSSGSKSNPQPQNPGASEGAVNEGDATGGSSGPTTGPGETENGAAVGESNAENPTGSTDLKFGLTTTRSDLLQRLGDDLAVKAKDFRSTADALQNATANYCADPNEEGLSAAQARWRELMNVWQYFEVFQVGPVSEGAKVLKYNIYAWPDPANYCRIDEEAMKAATPGYKLPPNYNRKGLQAVEYLLFEKTMAGRCSAGSAGAANWNALSAEAKVAKRCDYLTLLTSEIARQGLNLESKWGVPGNNYFSAQLSDPAKVNQLIQSLYEASYFVDLEMKNQKLAGPAGIDARYCDKAPEPCLEKQEFFFSGFSRQALDVNFQAFVDMLFGSASSGRAGGLSALVRAEGRGAGNAVADRTEAAAAQLANVNNGEKISSLDQIISQFAQENCDVSATTWVCQTRNNIRQIFSDFKGEYAAILNVKVPATAAGDND